MKPELVHSDIEYRRKSDKCLQLKDFSQDMNCLLLDSVPITFNSNYDINVPQYFSVDDSDNVCGYQISRSFLKQRSLMVGSQDFVYFKNPIGSNLQYKVINVSVRPGNRYTAAIEVGVKNGMILGTSLAFSRLFSPQEDNSWNDDWVQYISSIQGTYTFHNESGPQIPNFDVRVTIHKRCKVSVMLMESLSEEHWKRLSEVALAARFFQQSLGIEDVSRDIVASGDSLTHNLVRKRILLFASNDHWGKQITRGIESLNLFRSLSFEDQLIILKESYFAVRTFSFTHTFFKESNSFILNSPLGEYLLLCFNINTRRGKCNKMYDLYTRFLNEFYDFLRQDCFVITILSILSVYEEYTGLTCDALLKRERIIYTELLHKYIDAKVKSNQWPMSSSEIWDHIWKIKKLLLKWKSIYDQCTRSLYSNSGCQTNTEYHEKDQ